MASKLFVLAVVALFAFAAAADFPEEDDVIVLSDSNFDEAIAAHETLLVEFYAPWCGHCKKLAPEYAKAAAVLKKDGFRIAKMDATAHSEAPSRFDVEGFPTLKFFRSGKATDYTGGRTETEIVNWVRKKAGPAAKTLSAVADVESFKDASEVAVLGVFSAADSTDAKQFLSVAASNDDVAFGITTDSAVATHFGVSAPAIVLFKDFDEGRADFKGSFAEEEIAKFVSSNSLPLVVPFNQKNAGKIFGGAIKTHLLVFAEEGSKDYDKIMSDVKDVAKDVKGDLLVVSVGKGNERVLNYFGVTKADQPTAAVVNMPEGGSMKKYMLGSTDVTKAKLSAFTADYKAGKLSPHLKSEEAPADNSGNVKVLVGKTFESIVLDESKDVLVEFYAPWCGHCKSLAPIYEELGERFSGVNSVVIAKMDATANEVDHPAVNIRGFPTLKFFPAGSRKADVLDYEGARDLAGMTEFLKENAAIPFTLGEQDNDEL